MRRAATAAAGLKDGLVRPYIGYSRDINYPTAYDGKHIFFRMQFQNDLVRMFFSPDGKEWTKIPAVAESLRRTPQFHGHLVRHASRHLSRAGRAKFWCTVST